MPKKNVLKNRLEKELKDLRKEAQENPELMQITAVPKDGKEYEWIATMHGPKDTPFEGGVFKLDISFPPDYPFKPPKVEFVTRIYHPNVNDRGSICVDILKHNWSPALTISKVLMSICSLLMDPNENDPLDADVANVYKTDRKRYEKNVRDYVKKYAQVESDD